MVAFLGNLLAETATQEALFMFAFLLQLQVFSFGQRSTSFKSNYKELVYDDLKTLGMRKQMKVDEEKKKRIKLLPLVREHSI